MWHFLRRGWLHFEHCVIEKLSWSLCCFNLIQNYVDIGKCYTFMQNSQQLSAHNSINMKKMRGALREEKIEYIWRDIAFGDCFFPSAKQTSIHSLLFYFLHFYTNFISLVLGQHTGLGNYPKWEHIVCSGSTLFLP